MSEVEADGVRLVFPVWTVVDADEYPRCGLPDGVVTAPSPDGLPVVPIFTRAASASVYAAAVETAAGLRLVPLEVGGAALLDSLLASYRQTGAEYVAVDPFPGHTLPADRRVRILALRAALAG